MQSDLSQFYDRVRPSALAKRVDALRGPKDDPAFFRFARRFLSWRWDLRDALRARVYERETEIPDFSAVALPQGLVAAGFFANIALMEFDEALRESIGQTISHSIIVEDVCRYVDDLRIVISTDNRNNDISAIEEAVTSWLSRLLSQKAPGQKLSLEKTRAAFFKGDERPLVLQSRKMERIQSAISGGFGVAGGVEILDAVAGLVQSQRHLSQQSSSESAWALSPIADVRDSTVARFAAARFRTTFRSLRPLLDISHDKRLEEYADDEAPPPAADRRRSQGELDIEAKAFAYSLVEQWTSDPSNVRLLLIGLDLWPAADLISHILNLIAPLIDLRRKESSRYLVACYCLAEIFRAGAVETGLVTDPECLPANLDLKQYRAVLRQEGLRLLKLPPSALPWYLRRNHAVRAAEELPWLTGRS